MSHNILITGASGYLGGTLLARLASANLPAYSKLFALVRTDAQAEAVKKYSAEPLKIDLSSDEAVREAVLKNNITVVFYLINAMKSEEQVRFIKALAEVKKVKGGNVHFLHTSGAKIFSSHAGAPTERLLLDNEPGLYEVQKAQRPAFPMMQSAVNTNSTVVEQAEVHGVRSYIFAPCIVYGKGEGFGNLISIQTVAIVRAAKEAKRVYKTDVGRPTWPVCHIIENTTLYIEILRKILEDGGNLGYGKNGYYLASSGSVAWDDIYGAMAKTLAKHQVVEDEEVHSADDGALEKMGKALGCPKELVNVMVGGSCTFTAKRGYEIGWKPQYRPEHILEAAEEEVELILQNI